MQQMVYELWWVRNSTNMFLMGWGESLRWFPPYSILVFQLVPGSICFFCNSLRFNLAPNRWCEKVKKTNACQWDTFSDFMTQRSPKSITFRRSWLFCWNLDLFILATALVWKQCFRDLENLFFYVDLECFGGANLFFYVDDFSKDGSRMASISRLFEIWVNLGATGGRWMQFGLPICCLSFFRSLAQDTTQVIPGQASML